MNELSYLVSTGSAFRNLAEKICDSLGCPLGKMRTEHFADDGLAVFYEESIRGKDIFLVQSTYPNTDNITEFLLMTDAVKRALAHYTTTAILYSGWVRQGHEDKPRISIDVKLIVDLLSVAGITHLIMMDLHVDQIQDSFNVPVDHLYGSTVFTEYTEHNIPVENLRIATPDVGGTRRANSYARHSGVPMVICYKRRAKINEVAEMAIIGDVAGRDVILVDDIVDIAGTMTRAADLMLEHGAKSVRASAAHAIMSDPATKCIDQSGLTEMIFTDSIPCSKKSEKVRIISIVELLAESIRRVYSHESISSLYIF